MPSAAILKEEATREQILLAGLELFKQFGLRKTTMEDIARAVGKGKSSLYYYFKSKEEIFEVVLDRDIGKLLAQVEQAVAAATTTEDKLSAFSMVWLTEMRRRAALNSLLANEVLFDAKLVRAIRGRYRQQQHDLLRRILTADPALGLSLAELDSLLFIMLSSLYGLEQELLFQPLSYSPEPMLRLAVQALVKTLKDRDR